MPMSVTFLTNLVGSPPITIRDITKLEGIFGRDGKLTAYNIYTGSRPTDHYMNTRVEAWRVLKITSSVPDYYRPEVSNGE